MYPEIEDVRSGVVFGPADEFTGTMTVLTVSGGLWWYSAPGRSLRTWNQMRMTWAENEGDWNQ